MAEPRATVDILLGTFQGARFLPEQLRSLEAQTHRAWRLLVRDDNSTDATPALIEEFRARHPARVQVLRDEAGRCGAAGNFGRLLAASTADFSLLCDQDDVWTPTKIETLLALAASLPPGRPGLVHSDLAVVDREQRPVALSFWRYQHIDPARCRWPQLVVQNVVTGCACLVNAALRRAALPVPRDAIMHDWWLALVAAAAGEIRWTPAVTVHYRQHEKNDTGAKRWGPGWWTRQSPERVRDRIAAWRRQAAALAAHDSAPIPADVREQLRRFADPDGGGYWSRLRFTRRHGFRMNGTLRNLAFDLCL